MKRPAAAKLPGIAKEPDVDAEHDIAAEQNIAAEHSIAADDAEGMFHDVFDDVEGMFDARVVIDRNDLDQELQDFFCLKNELD